MSSFYRRNYRSVEIAVGPAEQLEESALDLLHTRVREHPRSPLARTRRADEHAALAATVEFRPTLTRASSSRGGCPGAQACI